MLVIDMVDCVDNSLAQLATQQIQQCTLACGIGHAAVVSNNQLHTWGSTKNGK